MSEVLNASNPVVYFIIGTFLIVVALMWPMTVRFAGHIDVFGRDGRLSVATGWGQALIRTIRTEQGRFDAVLEMRVLRRLVWSVPVIGQTEAEDETVGGPRAKYDQAADGSREGDNRMRSDSSRAGDDGGDGESETAPHTGAKDAFGLIEYAWERWRPLLYGFWAMTRVVLQRVSAERVHVRGWIGLEDSARTALSHGIVWALFGAAGAGLQRFARTERIPIIEIWPVYNRWAFRLEAEGSVRLRGIDLVWATMAGVREVMRRRKRNSILTPQSVDTWEGAVNS